MTLMLVYNPNTGGAAVMETLVFVCLCVCLQRGCGVAAGSGIISMFLSGPRDDQNHSASSL